MSRERAYLGVGALVIAAMLIALVFAARRRVPRPVVAMPEPRSRRLVREIAELDDAFESTADPADQARTEYEQRRALLKSELAHALADERERP
jgi:hypothetical protein